MRKFSVVAYLEGEERERVRSLQKELSEITNSFESLYSWEPHITLGDGVILDTSELVEVEERLEKIADKKKSFILNLVCFEGQSARIGGAGEITSPYALWVKVAVTEELERLVQQIREQTTSHYDRWYQLPEPYMPHVTLAFRDLTREGYSKGHEFLTDLVFQAEVKLSHISLVEKKNQVDEEWKRFYFKDGQTVGKKF